MPGEPVVLDNFGGIVSIARPEDIPEGASPRCNNVDFLTGRFIQRPGLESVYTNILTQFGPVTGTVAEDVDTESMPWTNPGNILLNDGSFATINLLGVASVNTVTINAGGYYALSETVTVTFSGTGSGATGTPILATITPPSGPQYKTVIGVTVTAAGSYTGTILATFNGAAIFANNATGTVNPNTVGEISDNIRVTSFGFALPANYLVQGIEVSVKGFALNASLFVQMVKGGGNIGDIKTVKLPVTNDFVNLGGSAILWGSTWNYVEVDAPDFGLELWVTSSDPLTVSLDFVEITIYGIPTTANFNGIVSANLNQTDQVALYLDSSGLQWKEDVTNAPNELALNATIPNAPPGSYMKGLDAGGTAYMAFSDLAQGTSQPLQYNGEWCDRVTQVGPGQPPVFTPQQATGTTFAITSITQHPPNSDITDPGHLSCVLQSAGPGSVAPGNVVTIYYSPSFFSGAPQPSAEDTILDKLFNSGIATYVYISGSTVTAANGTFLVTSVGNALPPGLDHFRYYFTVQVATTAFQKIVEDTGQYQMTIGTLTTAVPVPGLVVGNTVTISGASVATWDAPWPIVQAINSGEMVITQTSVTASVATYDYSVVSGAAPAAGELITVTNTTNAGGLLNVINATIATATGGGTGSFTIPVSVTSAPSVPESGQATTAGTIFSIDPGPPDVGTITSPILGNSTGGTLTFSSTTTGQFITAGTKQGSVFFITRNGAVTRPAPPAVVVIPNNTGSISASQIPVGPPNVIARGITFTESGQNGVQGANFYFYDTPVTYTINGIKFTSDALIVPDNVSTTATFSFSDSVLLASDEIDIPGNNYFNLIELGNPAWMFQYASRMLYGLCQTKIQNFLNLSFDGGYIPTLSMALPLPTGWSVNNSSTPGNYTITGFSITANEVTVEAVNSLAPGYSVIIQGLAVGTYLNGIPLIVDSSNGTQFTASFSHANVGTTADAGTVTVTNSSIGLVPSLDFGNAFRITNYGDTEWTSPTILFQPAYQDYLGVNIIQPNTPYSVRLKARSLDGSGVVTIQLPTYAAGIFGASSGSATFIVSPGGYVTQTAILIAGDGLVKVPTTMQIALGIIALAPGVGVEIDRIEVFPTHRPVDTTTIWTSYANKFESVDIVSGSLGVGAENPQPTTGAFTLLEQLYITKTKSLQVTQDSPNYEPNDWQVKQASDRCGAVGPNAFDEAEEFTVTASRNGLYFFDGGKPMPISQELQSTGKGLNLWDAINWDAGSTIWIRNDLNNRRLFIGVPMQTPNFWLPNAPTANPTSPNVILMCNYTGCPTGEELAVSDQVHVTMFGDLKSLDMRRKWALWEIVCPIAEFVQRQDGFTAPLFLCNGINSSKVYQLTNGAAAGGQNTDDGVAINWSYTTYAFVKAKQGQQLPGLGALRKVWYYLAVTKEGVGKFRGKLYSNSLGALPRNTFTIPLDFTLTYPQQNDDERVLEIGGQRVFVEFSSLGTGGYAEVGPIMLDGEMDKNAPHRGVAS